MDSAPDASAQAGWTRWSRLQQALLSMTVALLAALLAWHSAGWTSAEDRLRDLLVSTVRSSDPVPQVLVVDISEASIQAVGAWC